MKINIKELILKGVGEASLVYKCFDLRLMYDTHQWLKCKRNVCVSLKAGDWS